jgi:hypothetical protein
VFEEECGSDAYTRRFSLCPHIINTAHESSVVKHPDCLLGAMLSRFVLS